VSEINHGVDRNSDTLGYDDQQSGILGSLGNMDKPTGKRGKSSLDPFVRCGERHTSETKALDVCLGICNSKKLGISHRGVDLTT